MGCLKDRQHLCLDKFEVWLTTNFSTFLHVLQKIQPSRTVWSSCIISHNIVQITLLPLWVGARCNCHVPFYFKLSSPSLCCLRNKFNDALNLNASCKSAMVFKKHLSDSSVFCLLLLISHCLLVIVLSFVLSASATGTRCSKMNGWKHKKTGTLYERERNNVGTHSIHAIFVCLCFA